MDGEDIIELLLQHVDELIQITARRPTNAQATSAPSSLSPIYIDVPDHALATEPDLAGATKQQSLSPYVAQGTIAPATLPGSTR